MLIARPRRWSRTVFLAMALAACSDEPTTGSTDVRRCPQTYEFGNYGCAGLVVSVGQPASLLPVRFQLRVRAAAARADAGFEMAFTSDSLLRNQQLRLIRWLPGTPRNIDTVSVWISARLDDNTLQNRPNEPRTFITDSVLRIARFSPVGQFVVIDSVRLVLRAAGLAPATP